MARAKDLAALAGLAGLAYAMRKKDSDTSTTDTGDETERLKARKPAPEQSAGDKAVADTNSSVLTALQKPKNIREEGIAAANDVSTAPTALAPPKTKSVTTPANRNENYGNEGRDRTPPLYGISTRAGAGRGVVNPPSVTPSAESTTSSSEAGMKNYKPRRSVPPLRQAGMKKGGAVKKMASGGMTASKRADGIASKGKTKCKMY